VPGLVVRLELLARELDQLSEERLVVRQPLLFFELRALAVAGVGQEVDPVLGKLRALGLLGREDPADRPVFAGGETIDLALALHNKTNRDALHAASAQALGDLAPQQRRDFVADDAVEDSPRLLRVDPALVDQVRILERLLDFGLGDGVEDDALTLSSAMPSAC
jgi:hypothetical protein